MGWVWPRDPASTPVGAPPTFHSTSKRKSWADMAARVGGGAQATAQWEELQEAATAPGGLSRSAGAEPGVSHARPAHDPSVTQAPPHPSLTPRPRPPISLVLSMASRKRTGPDRLDPVTMT